MKGNKIIVFPGGGGMSGLAGETVVMTPTNLAYCQSRQNRRLTMHEVMSSRAVQFP